MTASADGKNIYATNELYADPPGSTVTSFAVDPSAPGSLKALGSSVSKGTACCHATMDLGGKHLLAANYMSGTAVVFGVRKRLSLSKFIFNTPISWYCRVWEVWEVCGSDVLPLTHTHAHLPTLTLALRFDRFLEMTACYLPTQHHTCSMAKVRRVSSTSRSNYIYNICIIVTTTMAKVCPFDLAVIIYSRVLRSMYIYHSHNNVRL